MSARLFSIKDDLVLKELYSRFTNKELVQVFNGQFSREQIKNRGKDLKLHKDNDVKNLAQKTRSGVWEDWEKEIIHKHYNKDGVDFVQNLIPNRTSDSIKHKAGRMGIIVSKEIRNYANGPKQHSDVSKHKMSVARFGKPFTDEHKRNIKLSAHRGLDHPHYNPNRQRKYGFGFTPSLKREILASSNNTCALCNKKRKVLVHHIDYNKNNNDKLNLITLCYLCHGKHHYSLSEKEKQLEQEKFVTIARLREAVV